MLTGSRFIGAKDQSSPLCLVRDTDTVQYADANNEDTNQTSNHTSVVHDNRFHSDGAFELIQTFP